MTRWEPVPGAETVTTPLGVVLTREQSADPIAPDMPPAWWYEATVGAVCVAVQPSLSSPGSLCAWIGDRSSEHEREDGFDMPAALAWIDARLVETRDALVSRLAGEPVPQDELARLREEVATEGRACLEVIDERDAREEQIRRIYRALGGDREDEWVARIPPQEPPDSGDAGEDSVALAEILTRELSEARSRLWATQMALEGFRPHRENPAGLPLQPDDYTGERVPAIAQDVLEHAIAQEDRAAKAEAERDSALADMDAAFSKEAALRQDARDWKDRHREQQEARAKAEAAAEALRAAVDAADQVEGLVRQVLTYGTDTPWRGDTTLGERLRFRNNQLHAAIEKAKTAMREAAGPDGRAG